MTSAGERALATHISWLDLPEPQTEYLFARPRRWRFDFAWPELLVAVEVEGGVYMKAGHHSFGKGFESDCEKYNTAAIAGWMVLRFTPGMIDDGRAIAVLQPALKAAAARRSSSSQLRLGDAQDGPRAGAALRQSLGVPQEDPR